MKTLSTCFAKSVALQTARIHSLKMEPVSIFWGGGGVGGGEGTDELYVVGDFKMLYPWGWGGVLFIYLFFWGRGDL